MNLELAELLIDDECPHVARDGVEPHQGTRSLNSGCGRSGLGASFCFI
jgi:hypothetical protein